MVRQGRIPPGKPVTQRDIETNYRLSSWEHLEEIGVKGTTAIVPFLRKKHATTLEEFFLFRILRDLLCHRPSHAPSQDTVRSQEIPVRYIDEPAAPKASKRKSMLEDSDIDEAPDEEKEEEPSQQMSTWEATPAFSLCQRGKYAVLKIDYPGKSGISVVKVVCNLFSSLLIVTAPVCDFFLVCWSHSAVSQGFATVSQRNFSSHNFFI